MTTTYHTPIANGASNDKATWNNPLSQLDAAISAVSGAGGTFTLANGAAAAAQKVVAVDSSSGFVAGASVVYTLVGGVIETNTIATVDSAIQITLVTNIGTGGIADNGVIAQVTPDVAAASTIAPYGGSHVPTLASAVRDANGGIYNVLRYGAIGNGSADDTAAIQAALDAAGTANGGVVLLPLGAYLITSTLTMPENKVVILQGTGHRSNTQGTKIITTSPITMIKMTAWNRIHDMTLEGADRANSNSRGIEIGNITYTNNNVIIENIRFQDGHYDCIYTEYECDNTKIEGIINFFRVGRSVIYHKNDLSVSVAPTAGMIIERCHFSAPSPDTTINTTDRYGIYLMGTEDCVLRQNIINGYDHAIYLDKTGSGRNYNLKIDGLHSETQNGWETNADWAATTAYSLNNLVVPTKNEATGFIYKCTAAGTSGGSEPTWPIVYDGTVVDGTVTWTAWRRIEVIHIAPAIDVIFGGLTLNNVRADNHLIGIHNEQTTADIIIGYGGNWRTLDCIYQHGDNATVRHQLNLTGMRLDGNLKPYRRNGSNTQLTLVKLENCILINDNIGLFDTTDAIISTWGAGGFRAKLSDRSVSSNTDLNWATDHILIVTAVATITIPTLVQLGTYGPTAAQQQVGYRDKEFIIYSATTSTVTINSAYNIYKSDGTTVTTLTLTLRGESVRLRMTQNNIFAMN